MDGGRERGGGWEWVARRRRDGWRKGERWGMGVGGEEERWMEEGREVGDGSGWRGGGEMDGGGGRERGGGWEWVARRRRDGGRKGEKWGMGVGGEEERWREEGREVGDGSGWRGGGEMDGGRERGGGWEWVARRRRDGGRKGERWGMGVGGEE